MRLRWVWIALALCGVALAWGAFRWADERSWRIELNEAKREVAGGQYQRARQRLIGLCKRRPTASEAIYPLGLCEEMLAQYGTVLTTLSRIPANDAFAKKATLARGRVLMNTGQFAPAEDLLSKLLDDRGLEGEQARQALLLLYHIQSRPSDLRDLTIASWTGAPEPATVLRKLYLLDHSAFPIDHVTKSLATADPNDDRVWLGKANLAAWTGRFGEALRLLLRCAERRPHDQAVWRARLDLARATGDIDTVRLAARHLSRAKFSEAELLDLAAWSAAKTGGREGERAALQALVKAEPGWISAWDRLAELALLGGRKTEAEGYNKRKGEMNVVRERYKRLLERDDRAEHGRELAGLATQLGRQIEARGWTMIDKGETEGQLVEAAAVSGERLADRLNPVLADGLRLIAPRRSTDTVPALLPSGEKSKIPAAPGIAEGQIRGDLGRGGNRAAGNGLLFADDAESAGLRFVHDNGHRKRNPPPPEAMCGGVALLDFDRDGWLDVYVVQGGPFPPLDSETNQGDRLFRNRGDGTFEDVSEKTGIASFPGGYGHGVTVGDFNNDGWPDLFITRWRSYALYRNTGKGTFIDATKDSGLAGDRDWPTSAAFADLDNDGDLDLYVCHYLVYDPSNPRRCTHPESPSKHECNPLDFPPVPDHVFRNDSGTFRDVTNESGFVDLHGRGLGVVAAHLDDDDKIDLYVANDMTANYLFTNRGGFHFEETGLVAGAAASADGGYKAGMGIALGDLDGDGLVDLAVTNYFGESTTFYRNLGQGFFADHSSMINMAAPTRQLLGFGIAFLDVDNDGWLDVLSANGHVLDPRPQIPWMMPLQIMQGSLQVKLIDVSETAGAPFRVPHLGRGLAAGDLDNDGRLDAVVVVQNEPLVYLHNRTEQHGHFIALALEGTKSNRDAVGARITIRAGGRSQVAQRYGGGSYQSAGDPRVHFGLGDASTVESLEVRWPSGQVDQHTGVTTDRIYRLREGAGLAALSGQRF
jgi:enediyne biosynthesis protein E4